MNPRNERIPRLPQRVLFRLHEKGGELFSNKRCQGVKMRNLFAFASSFLMPLPNEFRALLMIGKEEGAETLEVQLSTVQPIHDPKQGFCGGRTSDRSPFNIRNGFLPFLPSQVKFSAPEECFRVSGTKEKSPVEMGQSVFGTSFSKVNNSQNSMEFG